MSKVTNKHSFDLITPADAVEYDPLSTTKDVEVNITKIKGRKKPPVDYETIQRDFIKTDRNIMDVVIPFLMDKYSSGTSILYVMLYRLSYGFRKNRLKIGDDDLAKRTGIPKRTLIKYRTDLEECDLIRYERGYKTTRKPEYTILLPHQSEAFKNILHKTANILHKDVISSEQNTIYKVIDKHTKQIEEVVRSFYTSIGKTEYSLTRRMLSDGIRTIQSLIKEGYKLIDIQGCVKYTIETKPDVYSITFLNYTIGDYLVKKEEKVKQSAAELEEKKKSDIRNRRIALEKHLEILFTELPQSQQNTIKYDVELEAHKYMKDNNIKFGESFIISSYLNQKLEELFSDVVRNWG